MTPRDGSLPLIVGELNPYGADPYYALYPSPDGCTGDRLCRLILRLEPDDYLERFDRTNLCEGKWSAKAARERAEALRQEARKIERPAIILLGRKVAAAFHHGSDGPIPEAFSMSSRNGTDILHVYLPHPSGLCRAWAVPGSFDAAHEMIESLGFLDVRDPAPFANCNVCGRRLHGESEDQIGMCQICAEE